jgi:putative copper export protein
MTAALGSAVAQFLAYLGAVLVIGAGWLAIAVLPRYGAAGWHYSAHRRSAVGGLTGAAVLVIGHAARLWAQAYATFGVDQPLRASHAALIVTQTPWGRGWIVQALVAVAGLLGYVTARRVRGAAPAVPWIIAVGVALSLPLTGHAAAQTGRPILSVGLQTIHLLTGAGWLGTLLVIWLVCYGPGASRDGGHDPMIASLIGVFSPLAMIGAGVAVAAGAIIALTYFDTPAQLWTTSYGRTLLVKVSLVAITAGVGAYNWRRVRPGLGSPHFTGLLQRSAAAELVVALLLLATTAVLVGTPFPGE